MLSAVHKFPFANERIILEGFSCSLQINESVRVNLTIQLSVQAKGLLLENYG